MKGNTKPRWKTCSGDLIEHQCHGMMDATYGQPLTNVSIFPDQSCPGNFQSTRITSTDESVREPIDALEVQIFVKPTCRRPCAYPMRSYHGLISPWSQSCDANLLKGTCDRTQTIPEIDPSAVPINTPCSDLCTQIFDHLRDITDPEHPYTLEQVIFFLVR